MRDLGSPDPRVTPSPWQDELRLPTSTVLPRTSPDPDLTRMLDQGFNPESPANFVPKVPAGYPRPAPMTPPGARDVLLGKTTPDELQQMISILLGKR